jgi:hypothetical protein
MPSAGPAVDRSAARVDVVRALRAFGLALAALGSPPPAFGSINQVLAHGLTAAATEAAGIGAVIGGGVAVDGLSDPQRHRQGAARGGRVHGSDCGRAERCDESPWATAALEGQLALVRVALASEGNAPLNDAAFVLDQFAHGVRA